MPTANVYIAADVYGRFVAEANKSGLINGLLRKHYKMGGEKHGS